MQIGATLDPRWQQKLRGTERAVAVAKNNSVNAGARSLIGRSGTLQKSWNRQFRERRRNFPSAVIRADFARLSESVLRGREVKARVSSKAASSGTERTLRLQLEGGQKRAFSGNLLIPTPRTAERKTLRGRLRASDARGAFMFPRNNPRFLANERGGRLQILGWIRSSARIRRGWNLEGPLRIAGVRAEREFLATLDREIAINVARLGG